MRRGLVVAVAVIGLFGSNAAQAASPPLELERVDVRPARVVFDSGRALQVRVLVRGEGRHRLRFEMVKRGKGRIVKGFVRRIRLPVVGGRRVVRQAWAGRTWAGEVAPAGRYLVRVNGRTVGRVDFRTHLPAVVGETGDWGAIGEFGAARSGGRRHQGFDILAPCGRRLVAARGGRVVEVAYDPVLYGHYLKIRGLAESYTYFYSHLIAPPVARRGQRIRTGATVGHVGQTGNAASTPCHLHFEVHRGGRPLDPIPFLRAWKSR